MNTSSHRPGSHRRHLTAAVLILAAAATATSVATAAAAAQPSRSVSSAAGGSTAQTIHLVAHEKQRKFLNQGGFGDQEVFRGVLDNAAGTTQVGIFAGTLTSVSSHDSVNLATVDLQLPGGQITVQGFLGTQSPIIHAITGGTGSYAGAKGEFSFTSSSPACST